jgi:hypothetical protein
LGKALESKLARSLAPQQRGPKSKEVYDEESRVFLKSEDESMTYSVDRH